MSKDKNYNANGSAKSRAKKFATIAASSLIGISAATIVANIAIYDSFFERYERPNYDLYPGVYCYERIQDRLERECFKIPSGDNLLQAYYYPSDKARGLAVLAHGFHAGADDYLPLIEAIVNRGYSVITYDVTGTYSSGGDSVIGMCQSLRDIDQVLCYIKDDPRFVYMPKVVIGHSWGGYAAASVLALHDDIKAAALIAPMNNGSNVMIEKAEQYAGKFAYTAKPILDGYQKYLFGDYFNYNGVVGINSTDAPVLIAQGIDDTIITPGGQSITAHLDELTNPNVTIYWGEGSNGSHTGIWHSKESEEYQRVIASRIKKQEMDLGRKLTDSELSEIYSTVDHALYSQVNSELVDLIIDTFDKGINS